MGTWVSCLQENLNKGLAIVGRAVPTRTTLPVTQNVLLINDNSRLKLSATNLEIAISTWVGAKIEGEGGITVPARLLAEFVASLPAEPLEIALTSKPQGIHLQCARFEAHILGTEAQEFPPIPTVSEGVAARMDPATLRSAITRVIFAAAVEESRPILTGVKVELENDRFVFAAADGFRLAVSKGALLEPVQENISVVIPAKTLAELNRLLVGQEDPVEITVTASKSQILFRLKNIEMVSQLIQGQFPNYSQLIPQSYSTKSVVDLPSLLQASRAAAIFARDGRGIVRLQMVPGDGTGGKLLISARADEVGDDQGEIDALVEGPEVSIAFDSKYLTDVLSVLERGDVSIEVTSTSSPGVFKPLGSKDYIHVVMPMFVQW